MESEAPVTPEILTFKSVWSDRTRLFLVGLLHDCDIVVFAYLQNSLRFAPIVITVQIPYYVWVRADQVGRAEGRMSYRMIYQYSAWVFLGRGDNRATSYFLREFLSKGSKAVKWTIDALPFDELSQIRKTQFFGMLQKSYKFQW